MKKNCNKLFAFLLSLVLVLVALTPMISADEAETVEWTLSEDEQVLSDGTETYTFYRQIPASEIASTYVYIYSDSVTVNFEGDCYVCADPNVSGIVWLEGWDTVYLYANEEGKQKLDAWFIDRVIGNYRVIHDVTGLGALMTSELMGALNAAAEAPTATMMTMNVGQMQSLSMYSINAVDACGLFSMTYGAVYQINGEYYYLNYSTLDNSYFDADGKFSYREGTVTLILLEQPLAEQFRTIVAQADESFMTDYEYEYDDYDLGIIPEIVFWFFYVIVGILAPLPIIVLGVVLANIKKWGRPWYWYLTSVCGLLWLFLSIVLALVLILA